MKHFIIALAVCLMASALVPGCAKKPGDTTAVQGRQEKPAHSSSSGPGRESGEAPALNEIIARQIGVPVYPGAKQQNDLSTGTDSSKNTVFMVSFTTEDTMDEVIAFYRKNLAGYTESAIKNVNKSKMGGFRRVAPAGSEFVLIEQPVEGPVKISMTVNKAARK